MSVPPNIDRFNKATLLVFDTLYLAFPVPVELSASKIAMDTLPPDAEFDESFESIKPVFYTIEFLKKEGYIDYVDHYLDGTAFQQARLTSKSLALLGQTPDSLTTHVSIAETLRDLVKGGIKNVGSEAAKKAVELVFAHGGTLLSLSQTAGGG
ncbi:hypothetical protein AACH10_13380 [Ideonella sp. DXS22W]|uniref:Uncharacterized protein n=1 Tax=Pseudaquabacterium inlustre TaxID=2984192 RepID=A0ABU9CH97_9BURK